MKKDDFIKYMSKLEGKNLAKMDKLLSDPESRDKIYQTLNNKETREKLCETIKNDETGK